MFRTTFAYTLTLLLASAGGPVLAEEAATESEPEAAAEGAREGEQFKPPELTYQTGAIVLPNKAATVNLNERYRYLDPKQTETMLVAWGNPPGSETLGAVVPADLSPFDDGGWAVILTYIDEGHVDDKDAREIDYNDMLKDMQKDTREGSKEREQAGFGSVDLVGWAQQPHYDDTSHKLYWAKELKFGGADINTLNYDVRVLGREGVLSMNAVAGMPQIQSVERDMKDLLAMASFNPGYRYEEFNEGTDRMAAYGIGALVAGGIAAKVGLFAKLGALLLAFKKFIIIGVIALGGLLARIFKGRKASTAP